MYAMGRDILYPAEWEIARPNAIILLEKVNAFMDEFFPDAILAVRSGFRPSEINAKTPGAAKQSFHMVGKAIDIADNGQFFKARLRPEMFIDQSDRMRELGLFMEDFMHTPYWVHLDIGERLDRPSRIFRIK